MIFLKDVFLWKAMTGVALNTFPNALLIFDIYQCLLRISVIFAKLDYMLLKLELCIMYYELCIISFM